VSHAGDKQQQTEDSCIDAVIYAFTDKTIVIENPFTKKTAPGWFWEKFVGVRTFQFEFSLMNWPKNNLAAIVENQKDSIDELSKKNWHSWQPHQLNITRNMRLRLRLHPNCLWSQAPDGNFSYSWNVI